MERTRDGSVPTQREGSPPSDTNGRRVVEMAACPLEPDLQVPLEPASLGRAGLAPRGPCPVGGRRPTRCSSGVRHGRDEDLECVDLALFVGARVRARELEEIGVLSQEAGLDPHQGTNEWIGEPRFEVELERPHAVGFVGALDPSDRFAEQVEGLALDSTSGGRCRHGLDATDGV